MKYKHLTILVDLDSITANLQEKWYAMYNKDYNDTLTPDDIMSWDTHLYVKKECGRKIYRYFTPELFRSLNPMDGAQRVIKKWVKAGHRVVFVTASPQGCEEAKYQWVKEHFPFMSHRDVIMAHKKFIIKGDVLIDDSPGNIKAHRQHWGTYTKLYTIAYQYNKEVEDLLDLRLGSWEDTKTAWDGFDEAVDELARKMYKKPVYHEPTD